MSDSSDDILRRANVYATTRGIRVERLIGFGREARVYATSRRTAIKIHDDHEAFERELLCYIRLVTLEISEVLGHNVPELFDADEDLSILELTVVERPFLLDFGAARMDSAPDFPPEVLEIWEQEKIEQFGVHWPHATAIIDWMRTHAGVYLLDVHPGNIGFEE